jgi:biopolymer transport protein ExbD
MRFVGKKGREIVKRAELSLTPMVDVVFLLLIFFMVGLKFKEIDRELPADLPKQGLPEKRPPEPEIHIVITAQDAAAADPQPKIIVDGLPLTDWSKVYQILHQFAQMPAATETYHMVVAPDDEVPHDWVIRVLDYLNRLNYSKIYFRQ